MFSNFVETTNILKRCISRREFQTVPLLTSRISEGKKTINRVIYGSHTSGQGVEGQAGRRHCYCGNECGCSVNGKQFIVSGILESATGLRRDGYIHIEDAAEVLRMPEAEISEVAVRLKNFTTLPRQLATGE